jgi:hypothetical protein
LAGSGYASGPIGVVGTIDGADDGPRGVPGGNVLAGLVAAVAVLLVYRSTLLPGLYAWDTGEAQTVLPLAGTMHPTGFPAYVAVGWLASIVLTPFGDPAFRVNLLSALLAALAVGTTVVLLTRLRVALPVALAAGAGLGLTPITWRIAVAADAHALHLALVALLVFALVRWERLVRARNAAPGDDRARGRADRAIVLAAAVYGVAMANHGLTYLLAPAVGLYVLAVEPGVLRRPKLIVAALAACLGVAALLYLELPIRGGLLRAPIVYGNPATWGGFWDIVLARQFQGDVVGLFGNLGGKAASLVELVGAQLGPAGLLVVPAFLVTAWRAPRYALLSGVATGVTCLFAASYLNADIGRYYLGPALFAWSWIAVAAGGVVDLLLPVARRGLGAGAGPSRLVPSFERTDARGGTSPARVAARGAVALLLGAALLVPTWQSLTARHDAIDRSADTATATWMRQALDALAPDAVVMSWWSYSTPLWYGTLVEGRRPDVTIVDDSNLVYQNLGTAADVIASYLGRRPVYVIRSSGADLQALAVRFVLTASGAPGVYRVTGTLETTP